MSQRTKWIEPFLRPSPVWLPSPNRERGRWTGRRPNRRPVKVKLLVLHATVGGFVGSVDWLRKPRRKATSAHYVISKTGEILQIVSERDTAFHAGYGRWGGRGGVNARSIGFELENRNDGRDPYPKAQLEATLWLCLRAARKYRLRAEQVIGHFHVDPKRKTDPRGFPWDKFRKSLAAHLVARARRSK